MGGIRLENQRRWMVANWVLNRFLEIVMGQHPEDPEVARLLQVAIYHNGLHLDLIRKEHGEKADKVLAALKLTVASIENGAANLVVFAHDEAGKLLFLQAIHELHSILESE